MPARHPETLLIPYLRRELSTGLRRQVDDHMRGCPSCRASVESFAAVLDKLADVQPREPDWIAYDIEVHRRLAARAANTRSARSTLAASLAGAAIATAIALVILLPRFSGRVAVPAVDQLAMESDMGNTDVGLLRNYPMIEHLDLLENYDVIEHLDQTAPDADGDATRS